MSHDDLDAVTVHDAGGRRRFIRRGSALLLAGGAAAALPGTALAADCDRRGYTGEKQAGNGSDSDSGANGDRPGCGRHSEPPKISDASPREVPERRPRVGRVVG